VSLLYDEILISKGLDGEKVHSEKLTKKTNCGDKIES